jgi:hypothetical protein
MLWEVGEHAASWLEPIGKRLPKRFQCQCEARRQWLNIQGENCWKWLFRRSFARLHRRFRMLVKLTLLEKVTPKSELHAKLVSSGIAISERTMVRWLDEMGIKWLVMSSEAWYSL